MRKRMGQLGRTGCWGERLGWARTSKRIGWAAEKPFQIFKQRIEFKIQRFKFFYTKFDLGSNWDKFKYTF
jgi:hypothetical protein